MLLIVLFLIFLATSQSAPIGPSPSLGWGLGELHLISGREEPCLNPVQSRSVAHIIWACLTTIFVCTWVAVHPNMPCPKESGFAKLKRQLITMICALIAPEMMVVWAMRQRLEAKKIASKFNEKFNNGVPAPRLSFTEYAKSYFRSPSKGANFEGWTIVHGFFIQMGGFLVYDGKEPYKVLTWERMVQSIERGEIDIPVVPELDIVDKSKGDLLTKMLVVLQTSWFVLECAARWKLELPLAELEVLTLAFAALNVVIYRIWWDKPQGAMSAIRIQLKSSYAERASTDESLSIHTLDSLESEDTFVGQEDMGRKKNVFDEKAPFNGAPANRTGPDSEEFSEKDDYWFIRAFRKHYDSWVPPPRGIFSSRFQRHLRAALLIPVFWLPYFLIESIFRPLRKLGINIEDRVGRTRVPMFYAEDGSEYNKKAILYSIAISVAFGSLHLLSWFCASKTELHRWLWRGCSLFITLQPLLILAIFPCAFAKKQPWLTIVGHAIYYGLATLYGIARLILFFLAVSSLVDLPPDVHRDIDWLKLFSGII